MMKRMHPGEEDWGTVGASRGAGSMLSQVPGWKGVVVLGVRKAFM